LRRVSLVLLKSPVKMPRQTTANTMSIGMPLSSKPTSMSSHLEPVKNFRCCFASLVLVLGTTGGGQVEKLSSF